jgi:hypothetical protein
MVGKGQRDISPARWERWFYTSQGEGRRPLLSPEEVILYGIMGTTGFRERIVSCGAAMTALKTVRGHQGTLEQPVFPEGLLSEMGACGLKGAGPSLLGGDDFLVERDGRGDRPGQGRGRKCATWRAGQTFLLKAIGF